MNQTKLLTTFTCIICFSLFRVYTLHRNLLQFQISSDNHDIVIGYQTLSKARETDHKATDSAAVADSAIKATIENLEQLSVPFYIYDDPDITLPAAIHGHFDRANIKWRRYQNQIFNDQQIIAALERSPLRTYDPKKAKWFIPPIPFGKIFTSRIPQNYIHTAMKSLLNHTIFKQHQGHNHLLISTTTTLFRGTMLNHCREMRPYYSRIYNATAFLSWDPSATYNDLHHTTNNEWSEYRDVMIQETTPPLISRTASLAFGMKNDQIPLTLATSEKFHNSSNFIFYYSPIMESFHNSTIYRYAPITNITQDSNFPQSSIGRNLEKDQWLRDHKDSKFCLVIRGDNPSSHALWRSIRLGCIPVIISDNLPVWGPILKSTLNMSDYGVIVSEKSFVNDPTSTLLKLNEMTKAEIEVKIKYLAFAQRVIFTDHPNSLFVPAFLKEAQMASTVIL